MGVLRRGMGRSLRKLCMLRPGAARGHKPSGSRPESGSWIMRGDMAQDARIGLESAKPLELGVVSRLPQQLGNFLQVPGRIIFVIGQQLGQPRRIVEREILVASNGLCGQSSAAPEPIDHGSMLDSQSPPPALHFLHRMWSIAMPRTPRDLADRMAVRRRQANADDGYVRETFTLPRDQARQTARGFLDRWPAAAYMTAVESWRELPDGEIEFTMKRLRSAD